MRVPCAMRFILEVEVEHLESHVYVRVTEVDSDGGLWFYPRDVDESDALADYTRDEVAGLSDLEIAQKALAELGEETRL